MVLHTLVGKKKKKLVLVSNPFNSEKKPSMIGVINVLTASTCISMITSSMSIFQASSNNGKTQITLKCNYFY